MKKLIALMTVFLSLGAFAQQVNVSRESIGSGQPGTSGFEQAQRWGNDIYHAPQYMPGWPTAATLWPRIVDVKCIKSDEVLDCSGYHWTPDMGRGEYLMIHPTIKEEVKNPGTTITITPAPVIIYKEVPRKPKGG